VSFDHFILPRLITEITAILSIYQNVYNQVFKKDQITWHDQSEMRKSVQTKKKSSSVNLWVTNEYAAICWLTLIWVKLVPFKLKKNSIFSNDAQLRAFRHSWNRVLTKKRCNSETNEFHLTKTKSHEMVRTTASIHGL
jgi:hypothetical protein